MDPDKVNLKFKKSKSGKAIIAYCDEYPEVSGSGTSEEQAIASFWKLFNAKQIEVEHEETLTKKVESEKKAS